MFGNPINPQAAALTQSSSNNFTNTLNTQSQLVSQAIQGVLNRLSQLKAVQMETNSRQQIANQQSLLSGVENLGQQLAQAREVGLKGQILSEEKRHHGVEETIGQRQAATGETQAATERGKAIGEYGTKPFTSGSSQQYLDQWKGVSSADQGTTTPSFGGQGGVGSKAISDYFTSHPELGDKEKGSLILQYVQQSDDYKGGIALASLIDGEKRQQETRREIHLGEEIALQKAAANRAEDSKARDTLKQSVMNSDPVSATKAYNMINDKSPADEASIKMMHSQAASTIGSDITNFDYKRDPNTKQPVEDIQSVTNRAKGLAQTINILPISPEQKTALHGQLNSRYQSTLPVLGKDSNFLGTKEVALRSYKGAPTDEAKQLANSNDLLNQHQAIGGTTDKYMPNLKFGSPLSTSNMLGAKWDRMVPVSQQTYDQIQNSLRTGDWSMTFPNGDKGTLVGYQVGGATLP